MRVTSRNVVFARNVRRTSEFESGCSSSSSPIASSSPSWRASSSSSPIAYVRVSEPFRVLHHPPERLQRATSSPRRHLHLQSLDDGAEYRVAHDGRDATRIFSAAVAAHRYAARPSAGDDSSPSSAFHAANRASNGAHKSSVTARRHAGTAAKTSSPRRRRNAFSASSAARAAPRESTPAASRVASAPVAIAQRSRKRSNAARTLG